MSHALEIVFREQNSPKDEERARIYSLKCYVRQKSEVVLQPVT